MRQFSNVQLDQRVHFLLLVIGELAKRIESGFHLRLPLQQRRFSARFVAQMTRLVRGRLVCAKAPLLDCVAVRAEVVLKRFEPSENALCAMLIDVLRFGQDLKRQTTLAASKHAPNKPTNLLLLLAQPRFYFGRVRAQSLSLDDPIEQRASKLDFLVKRAPCGEQSRAFCRYFACGGMLLSDKRLARTNRGVDARLVRRNFGLQLVVFFARVARLVKRRVADARRTQRLPLFRDPSELDVDVERPLMKTQRLVEMRMSLRERFAQTIEAIDELCKDAKVAVISNVICLIFFAGIQALYFTRNSN